MGRDVYVNVAGGVRIEEPSADLAVALAIASSRLDAPLPPDVAACGEVGLGGEVRRVGRMDARLREARRLGFRRVLLPEGLSPSEPAAGDGAEVRAIAVADVAQAVRWLRETAAWGFPCVPMFERDPWLDPIRKSPEFVAFMAELRPVWERDRRELEQPL